MFTGLVAEIGSVVELAKGGDGTAKLRVRTTLAGDLGDGDSIAVNGVCLTATTTEVDTFTADVVAETLGRSALGALGPGAQVNLELPVRAGDRLGGHFVLGHVDGLGEVVAASGNGELQVALAPALLRYVVEKGSIALDGVSLTVAGVDTDSVTVALVPQTRERTTLGAAQAGTRLNVEVDVLAKHVEKLVSR